MEITTAYHDGLFESDTLRKRVQKAIEILGPEAHLFDSIAVTGVSGLMVGPAVAMALGKSITVVRKGEPCHAIQMVEGAVDCRYLIIDDFRSTGRTLHRVQEEIHKAYPASECVGCYLHRDWDLVLKGRTATKQDYFLSFPA
jgi:adenine/guanine phosphoribosyltransferase-like PRPP-binding protein